jgi:antitoxin ParD1/3/4
VREKVARGDYASDSEVLRDALRERDRAIEAWLQDEVVPAAKALREIPGRALTADEVRAELAKARAGRRWSGVFGLLLRRWLSPLTLKTGLLMLARRSPEHNTSTQSLTNVYSFKPFRNVSSQSADGLVFGFT